MPDPGSHICQNIIKHSRVLFSWVLLNWVGAHFGAMNWPATSTAELGYYQPTSGLSSSLIRIIWTALSMNISNLDSAVWLGCYSVSSWTLMEDNFSCNSTSAELWQLPSLKGTMLVSSSLSVSKIVLCIVLYCIVCFSEQTQRLF